MPDRVSPSRRDLMLAGGLGLVGLTLADQAAAAPVPPVDAGTVAGGKVQFPPWLADTERPTGGPPNPTPPDRRVGFAVLGLGRLALEQILPAFAQAKRARLAALVSGSPDKAATVAAQYGLPRSAVYGYDTMDRLRDDPAVQVVYVVTPNALHAEHATAAFAAGKHVLSEKPMAASSAQARSMSEAAKAAGRKLMVAYRIQYEPNNREAQRLARSGELGPLRLIDAINTQDMGDPTQWRLKRALSGGGSLPDIGLYCLNTARFVTGEEPVEVDAATWSTPDDPRFREVEEAVSFRLRFPSGTIANCLTSYGAHELRRLKLIAPGGWAEIEDAFAYRGQRLRVARRSGEAEAVEERKLEQKNQFALELDHMAECVQADRTPRTPGEEGLQDHLLMEAIYESARTGRPVAMPPAKGLDVTRGPEPEQG